MQPGKQPADGAGADLRIGLHDGGQRRFDHVAQRDTVIAQHGDVARHAQAEAPEVGDHADGQQVIGAEKGGGRIVCPDQRADLFGMAGSVRWQAEWRGRRQPVRAHGVLIAGKALARAVRGDEGSRHHDDAAMPGGDQGLHAGAGAAPVVHRY
ncbi:hypothetical protein AWV79_25695 [Cupriavidus sp. UYMMa02A]|nr:hypothetical protein AWV79_25695 [Cupriavidus sp. UYMMa02A]